MSYTGGSVYPDLPASDYEYVSDDLPWDVPFPFELYPSGILRVPTKELNSCTFVLIKNICGLHLVGNRISIQTSVPCQGQSSYIMFICPAGGKQKIVDFILRVIQYNKDEGLT